MTGPDGTAGAVTASEAVAPAVTAPPATVTVLAAFEHAVYLDHPGGLLALVTSDGVHLPNALVLGRPAHERPLAGCRPHQRGRLGRWRLRLGDLDAPVTRWWRPRPVLRPVSAPRLRGTLDTAARHLEMVADAPPDELTSPLRDVAAAMAAGDARAAVTAGRALIGRGPGLTPAGDDVLAGLVAGAQLLAPAVAGPAATTLTAAARETGAALAGRAAGATTAVSAALLRHAARGEVAEPAAHLLRALTGHGDVAAAVDRLRGVGSTSGRDLLLGLLAAGEVTLTFAATATHRRTA